MSVLIIYALHIVDIDKHDHHAGLFLKTLLVKRKSLFFISEAVKQAGHLILVIKSLEP